MSRALNRIISKWGTDVIIKPRKEIVNDLGNREYSYPEEDWIYTRSLLYDGSGLREIYLAVGVREEVDYVASFSSKYANNIKPYDLISIPDGTEFEVTNVIKRGRGEQIDFVEVLMTKR